jgi:phytoene/squalene synthetase
MKETFDQLSEQCSKKVTSNYSTSFSLAVNLLSSDIQSAIHSIYGFVRFADEIVDTFLDWDREYLINKFERDFYESLEIGISLNPILHSFQNVVKKYNIDIKLIDAFLKSMKMDLIQSNYETKKEYDDYIYGSADVVGLMCLHVFVDGDMKKFNELKDGAMSLGSAFQKVNFLRDLKQDTEILNRSYFPHVDFKKLDPKSKDEIIKEIENDFNLGFAGICGLPASSKFGVYTAYVYYKQLLKKLKRTPSKEIMDSRIRVSNPIKFGLLAKSFFVIKLNLI